MGAETLAPQASDSLLREKQTQTKLIYTATTSASPCSSNLDISPEHECLLSTFCIAAGEILTVNSPLDIAISNVADLVCGVTSWATRT